MNPTNSFVNKDQKKKKKKSKTEKDPKKPVCFGLFLSLIVEILILIF